MSSREMGGSRRPISTTDNRPPAPSFHPKVPSRPGRTSEDFKKPRPHSQDIRRKPVVPSRRPSSNDAPVPPTRTPPSRNPPIHEPVSPPSPPRPKNHRTNSERPAPPVPNTRPNHPNDNRSVEHVARIGKYLFNSHVRNSESEFVIPKRRVPPRYVRVDSPWAFREGFLATDEDDVIEVNRMHVQGDIWEGRLWEPMLGKAVGESLKFISANTTPVNDPYDPFDPSPFVEEWEDDPVAVMQEHQRQEKIQDAMKQRHKQWRGSNRLFLALLELLTNEFKYVTSMKTCFEIFVGPMHKEFGAAVSGSLFPNWEEMWKTHLSILKDETKVSRPFFQQLNAMRNPNRSSTTKPNRQSLSGNLAKLSGSNVELLGIGEELDNIQNWHDENVLDRDEELTDDFFDRYNKTLACWAVKLCAAVGDESSKLKVSGLYIRNYSEALNNVSNWSTTIPRFTIRIHEIENHPLANGLSLTAFLIKPVQHICRYPLLIREVHRNVPESIEQPILEAQKKLVEATTEVNSMQSNPMSNDNRMSVLELQETIRYPSSVHGDSMRAAVQDCKGFLSDSTAYILNHGYCIVHRDSSPAVLMEFKTIKPGAQLYFFLLNLCILITERSESLIKQERFKLRGFIRMDSISDPTVVSPKRFRVPLKGGSGHWEIETIDMDAENTVRDIQQALAVLAGAAKRYSGNPSAMASVPHHGSFQNIPPPPPPPSKIQTAHRPSDLLMSELHLSLASRSSR